MKTYRETMAGLSFSPEQKTAMTEELLSAVRTKKRRVPRKYTLAAVIAALLALTVTACATGGFQALSVIFASILRPFPTEAQTRTIEQFFTPIGVSDTDNGVTLTAEGVMGDTHSTAVLYSIRRDSGEPLITETEDTRNVSNGDNTLMFEQHTGSSTIPLFLDFTLSDSTLYFLDIWTCPNASVPLTGHTDVTFENLFSSEEIYGTATDGMKLLVDRGAIAARYDPETAFPEGISREQWVEGEIQFQLIWPPISLAFTDGSTVSLYLSGDISQEGHAILSDTFGEIYPLDTIESITIGDLTLPVAE